MLLVLLVVSLFFGSTVSSAGAASLDEMEGKVYRVYEISPPEGPREGFACIGSEAAFVVSQVFGVFHKAHDEFLVNLSGSARVVSVGEEKFYIYDTVFRGRSVQVIYGDRGHIRISVEGYPDAEPANCSLSVVQEYVRRAMRSRVNLSFAGMDSGLGDVGVHSVYLVMIDGLPVRPLLRVKCVDPGENDGYRALYMEGMLPVLRGERGVVHLDSDTIRGIARLLRENGVEAEASSILVLDVYYTYAPPDMLAPTLLLSAGKYYVEVQLLPDGPNITGIQVGGDPSQLSSHKVNWDYILSQPDYRDKSRIVKAALVYGVLLTLFIALYVYTRR